MPAKRIKVLIASFDTLIKGHEIPAFRGAIIQKVGQEHDLFHNHMPEAENKFHFRYPLIQYKSVDGHPALFCIDEGVDELKNYFENKNWNIEISGRELSMNILDLSLEEHAMEVHEELFHYGVKSWIALNSENYHRYQALKDEAERKAFLENVMKANILAFGRGINWQIDKQVQVEITNAPTARTTTLKKQRLIAFDLEFTSNVYLPEYVGLGKSVSFGYGCVTRVKA